MKNFPIILSVLLTILLAAVFLLLALPGVSRLPFSYDEADYVYASHQGWLANWIDHPALSIVEFIRLGLGSGRDNTHRADLSALIRNSGDIHFYRHWHGPLFYQWLGFLGFWTSNEYSLRLLSLLIPAAGVILVYWGCLWVLPSQQLIALFSAGLYAAGYSVVASPELAPHQLFVVVSLANLFCLAKLDQSRDPKWWWWSCFWAAVSFVTIEVAFVNIAVVLFFAWRCRATLRPNFRFWSQSFLLFVFTSLFLWPAGILKLEPVRSYVFMAYLAIFRKGAWGDTTLTQTWLFRFRSEPVEWILVAVALFLWWFLPEKPAKNAALPFLLYGCVMLLAMFRVNAVVPHYALPYLAPLTVFAGIALGAFMQDWPKLARVAATGVALLLVAAGTHCYVHAHLPAADSRTKQILDSPLAPQLDGKLLLAPQGDVSVLHYYFPRTKLLLYLDEDAKRRALAEHEVDAVLSDEKEPFSIRLVNQTAP
jgi:hypothetical protein